MLKRIETAKVELGMFIHKLEGSWFDHPFWKSRFLLEDPEKLADLRESDVRGVIIDTSKGKDCQPHQAEAAAKAGSPPAARDTPACGAARPARRTHRGPPLTAPRSAPAGNLRSTMPLTMAREFGNAKQVATSSKKVITKVFLNFRLGKAVRISDVEPVVEDIFASVQRNPFAFSGLMRCKQDHEFIYRRALTVCALMVSLARQMKLLPQETREAGMVGLLMDIGVCHLPADLFVTEGDYRRLDPEIRKQHVMLGHARLVAAGDVPEAVLDGCLRHHEMLDGSGYPQGLRGTQIDRLSRMAAICDSFDALAAADAGGDGLDPAEAIRRLAEQETKYDREILRHFIDSVGVYPIGSFVRLRSGRLAMVVEQDLDNAAHPVVLTFHSLSLDKPVRAEKIALGNCYGKDEIVCVADLAGAALPEDLSRLRERLLDLACRQ